jgi:hypothetical protein
MAIGVGQNPFLTGGLGLGGLGMGGFGGIPGMGGFGGIPGMGGFGGIPGMGVGGGIPIPGMGVGGLGGLGGLGGGGGGGGGAGALSPDIQGQLQVNQNTGLQSLALAQSQLQMSQQMSAANNINAVASAQRDMTFGSNSQLRQAAQRLFQ